MTAGRNGYELTDEKSAAECIVGLLDAEVQTVHGPLATGELWERYNSTPYAVFMDGQPFRYSQHFGYAPEHMIMDMGVDVIPREHQMQTGMCVTWILNQELEERGRFPIASEDIGPVVLAALIHDAGETMHPEILAEVGAVVGDIPYGQKTDADRATEAAVRAALYRRIFSDVDPAAIAMMEGIISHQDTTTRHDLFEAAHDAQTFMTAVHTGRTFAREWWALIDDPARMQRTDEELLKMQGLFTAVLDNMIPRMNHWAQRFAFIRALADQHHDLLDLHEPQA